MTCAFSWTKGHLHKHPTPPPPILMGFSEGKLCSDSFIHVVFSKRMSKKFNSPCQHFNIIVIFYLFFIPVHVGLLISDLSISVSKDIRQFYYWNGSFSIPPDHNIFLLTIYSGVCSFLRLTVYVLQNWRDLHFHEHFQLKISSKCDIKAENSSNLCKFHKGRKGLRPMGSNANHQKMEAASSVQEKDQNGGRISSRASRAWVSYSALFSCKPI